MKYPKSLPPGGTIGFPAPSFGCSVEPYKSAFQNALKTFEQKGYAVQPGPNAFAGKGIGISNKPSLCGQELMEMYLDPKVHALISCGGGELMCETLDYLDFSALSPAEPKWYMGYSDNTNFTFLLTTLCDTASIYGPCAPAFGMEPWHPALEDAFALLRGEQRKITGYPMYETESLKDEIHPLEPYHVTVPRYLVGWPAESDGNWDFSFEGRLIGGCMDCLVNLTGTRYDGVRAFAKKYAEDGLIWFLEACDLNPFAMRRAVWQMKRAGWFEHVKGFLIGRPMHHGEVVMGLDQYRAVVDLLADYQVPVIMDLDIGHIPPMMPLICGSYAKVVCRNQEFGLDMELK